jgi:UDP-N-acetyl-D-mannosaminouronate:lipid I N-acetyl-D-mannosaminouronosyltransferase
MIQPVEINNRNIYPFKSKEELLDTLSRYSGLLIAIGAEKLLSENEKLVTIINENMAYCDGYGAVYALKRKGVKAEKIPGAYLWLDLIRKEYVSKRFYLLGAKEETLNKTISKLHQDFPGIKIVGSHNGYFKEDKKIMEDIKMTGADIIFVALGSPKQEFFMSECFKSHRAIYMGLGGSFDLYTGNAKPVPKLWLKYVKWEGLYRTLMDFTNIKRVKRQVILFKYIGALLHNKI